MVEVFRTDGHNKTELQVAQEFAESFPEPRKAKFIGHHTFKLVDGNAEYSISFEWKQFGSSVYIVNRN